MKRFFTKQTLLNIFIIISILVCCYVILPVSIPLIGACITALLLAPIVKLLQRKFSLSQKLSVLIIFIIFIMVVGFSMFFITTKVIAEAIQLISNMPQYFNEINVAWKEFERNIIAASERFPKALTDIVSDQIQVSLDAASAYIGDYISMEKLTLMVKAIPSYLISSLVYLIALFLFMLELPKLKVGVFNYLKDETAEKITFIGNRLVNVIAGFFKAQFLVSIIIFIVTLVGLLFIKPEMAIFMSLVVWIIDFIPIIGSIVIMAPWSGYYFITGEVMLGVQLSVLAIILLIIRRTVEPKIMGNHIGLSPLLTLITMYIGLKLFGIIGVIAGPLLLITFGAAREAGLFKGNFKL
ncbi:MAG: sporulation integral membrane protein YtvI [Bacillus sp. (in: firmicutes)]